MASLSQAERKLWRTIVLDRFRAPPSHNLILAADPDGLLLEEQVLAALASRGFDLLVFDDPVAFRYVYESHYRDHWGEGPGSPPALIVRTDRADVRSLPYDLLQAGRAVTLTLHDLCPSLSYPVVRDFFRAAPDLLDTLLDACREYQGPQLSDQRSLAFIARHVYGLDPISLAGPNDLVERLLAIHYPNWSIPERLQAWLAALLRQTPALADLPVERWLADRRAFFGFLEDQWRLYLRQEGLDVVESGPAYALSPLVVDFSRPSIRSLTDTLFLASTLRPATIIAERPPQDWRAVGVAVDALSHRTRRLERLLDLVNRQMPGHDASCRAWLDLAPAWAETLVLAERVWVDAAAVPADLRSQHHALQQRLTTGFAAWLQAHYNTLHSLPYLPAPVLGHQVAHFLAHRLRHGSPGGRVALIVFDGLALDQWQVLRDAWRNQGRAWHFDEQAMLAVLPTVTPIARQAIFAGQLPLYFPDTWQRTDVDGRRWQRFWEDQGLSPGGAAWLLGADQLDLTLMDSRVRALGLVITGVDEMVHGTVHGRGELHDRVRHWTERGMPGQVVERLLAAKYDVWLTSDHGNVEARGIGRHREGVLVEQRGSRVRFYTDPAFLQRAQSELAESLAWTPGGLPPGLLTLFAADRAAFANRGEALITHGGLSLEEVIVPWVHITKGER